ncbi:Gfo/Idh/MocA family protein [Microbacterium sp. 22303]|uniref:Gfo/Idh/MocA family protein n=1 Tax=Microbacterium sp. 22303 TaxID=3453905 RepID=UPI003F85DD49
MTRQPDPIRFGLIGVDSPHAPSFTRLFGDGRTGIVEGGTITAAWQDQTDRAFPPSLRGPRHAMELAGTGVELLGSPEEVVDAVDAVLIVAADARRHPSLFDRVVTAGKPVYVDTRFATTRVDAERMLRRAERTGALVLAGSPKRFTPEFRRARGLLDRVERVRITGPLPVQPGLPGLHWYGVHLIDLAVAALGSGFDEISAHDDRFRLRWADGRVADIGGPVEWGPETLGDLRDENDAEAAFRIVSEEPMLTGLLRALVAAVRTGVPTVPVEEILDIVTATQRGSHRG